MNAAWGTARFTSQTPWLDMHLDYPTTWKSVYSAYSALSTFTYVGLLCLGGVFSLASVASVASIGSVLSIASVGSFLSIGSHQSILAIGCSNAFMAVCGTDPDTTRINSPGPPEHWPGVGFSEVQHNHEHASLHSNCNATIKEESVTIYNGGNIPRDLQGAQIHVFDDDVAVSPTDDTKVYTFDSESTLGVHNISTICLAYKTIGKSDVVALVMPGNVIVSAAQMARFYSWTNTSAPYLRAHSVEITIAAADWDLMATCTLHKKQLADPPPSCDYVEAMSCRINDNNPVKCEVKRKGTASWRAMDKKPSIKVKFESGNHQRKLTLNSMVQDPSNAAEVTSYGIFASLGVPAPRAHHSMVTLIRNGTAGATPKLYTSVEEPDTPEFITANGLDGSSMWEYERGTPKHEFGQDLDIIDVLKRATNGRSLAHMWSVVDKEAMFRYYTGEVATGHIDGLCRMSNEPFKSVPNNAYAVRSLNGKYQFIPWGLDQTNRCERPLSAGGYFRGTGHIRFRHATPWNTAACDIMRRCFESQECRKQYNRFAKSIGSEAGVTLRPCEVKTLYGQVTALILIGAAVLVAGVAWVWPGSTEVAAPPPRYMKVVAYSESSTIRKRRVPTKQMYIA